jgi:hypothetical protein
MRQRWRFASPSMLRPAVSACVISATAVWSHVPSAPARLFDRAHAYMSLHRKMMIWIIEILSSLLIGNSVRPYLCHGTAPISGAIHASYDSSDTV